MKEVGLRMGQFPDTLIGMFDFHPEDFLSNSTYFGLYLTEAYFLGHFRSKKNGRAFHVTRPVISTSSSGLSLSIETQPGGIYHDERGNQFMRGGIYNRYLDEAGNLVLRGGSGFWSGSSPLEVEGRFGKEFVWKDSGLLDIRGRLLGPATQTYVSSRRNGNGLGTGVCHMGVFYEADGEILGEPVSGCFTFEQVYCAPGETLADSVIRQRLVGSWSAFSTIYEDGSVQYGNIGYGAGPWHFANIMDDDRHIRANITDIHTEADAEGLGKRIVYTLNNGEQWESIITMTLMDMVKRARALGSNVQAHKGYIQRVGESRKRRDWYAIQEWIPERLVPNAPEEIGRELPREF